MISTGKICRLLCGCLACFILLASQVSAAEKQPQEDWEKICARVSPLPFPAPDRPSPQDLKALDQCSAYDLYYGFGGPANPAKARLCAYAEMAKPRKDSPSDSPFTGEAILMTIYANGVGAKRNFDLALKLACKIGGAPLEIEGRVNHLAELKAKNWQGNNFSLCDDITSGYMAGFCADHRSRFTSQARDQQLGKIQSGWSNADQKEYARLRRVALQYFDVHAENEVDQSGTARAALSIEDTQAQEEDFKKALDLLEKGKFPKVSPLRFKDADARLNAVYQDVQRKFDPSGGTITKEGIRTTQRTWVRYRDAWVTFVEKKYTGYTSDSIKAYWTLKRIKELEESRNE